MRLLSFCLHIKDLEDPNILGDKLQILAGIVFRKHYYASFCDKDDLLSVGVLKALSLINEGNFSKKKGTLLNYLYTGMRNEMHNYLYHKNKKLRGCDVVPDIVYDNYFEDYCFDINLSVIHEVCKEFSCYGNIIKEVVLEMSKRGFRVVGDIKLKLNRNAKQDKIFECEDFKTEVVDRLCGAVVWINQESSL